MLAAETAAAALADVPAAARPLTNVGKFDLVVAGGVSTGVGHGWMSGVVPAGSRSGDMRVYDVAPTGTLPGEGCGAVALMRAADAQAAGLPVYAEIAGWHAADRDSQSLLSAAYARANVNPAGVQLLEGHGAATAAEDLAELSALPAWSARAPAARLGRYPPSSATLAARLASPRCSRPRWR